jgi:hypothetical protein
MPTEAVAAVLEALFGIPDPEQFLFIAAPDGADTQHAIRHLSASEVRQPKDHR